MSTEVFRRIIFSLSIAAFLYSSHYNGHPQMGKEKRPACAVKRSERQVIRFQRQRDSFLSGMFHRVFPGIDQGLFFPGDAKRGSARGITGNKGEEFVLLEVILKRSLQFPLFFGSVPKSV
jgi:hypothetical protein